MNKSACDSALNSQNKGPLASAHQTCPSMLTVGRVYFEGLVCSTVLKMEQKMKYQILKNLKKILSLFTYPYNTPDVYDFLSSVFFI